MKATKTKTLWQQLLSQAVAANMPPLETQNTDEEMLHQLIRFKISSLCHHLQGFMMFYASQVKQDFLHKEYHWFEEPQRLQIQKLDN